MSMLKMLENRYAYNNQLMRNPLQHELSTQLMAIQVSLNKRIHIERKHEEIDRRFGRDYN
ncbi:hypothetical protein KAR91_72745 [Candidatus Pacearchaeota archaeon]|nr:hypothetical protein [Candidatus Pacearchaeota archaeon]